MHFHLIQLMQLHAQGMVMVTGIKWNNFNVSISYTHTCGQLRWNRIICKNSSKNKSKRIIARVQGCAHRKYGWMTRFKWLLFTRTHTHIVLEDNVSKWPIQYSLMCVVDSDQRFRSVQYSVTQLTMTIATLLNISEKKMWLWSLIHTWRMTDTKNKIAAHKRYGNWTLMRRKKMFHKKHFLKKKKKYHTKDWKLKLKRTVILRTKVNHRESIHRGNIVAMWTNSLAQTW